MAKKATAPITKTAADVIKELQKTELGQTIMTAKQASNPFHLRRPSGIMSLDVATGGGLPAGGLSQLSGPEGVGKNFLAYQYMKRCQEIYGGDAAIAIACLEFPLDKEYARKAGVQLAFADDELEELVKDRQKLEIPELTKKDKKALQTQLGEFVVLQGDSSDVLNTTLDIIASNKFQLVVIDSWNPLLSPEDSGKNLGEDKKVASEALLLTHFMQLYHKIMCTRVDEKPNLTTTIGIRQVRANLNRRSMFQKPWATGGAYSMRHGLLVRIELSPGGRIQPKASSTPIGKEINWSITKGKAGCHDGPKGSYNYLYDPPSIEAIPDLFQTAVEYGVITQSGAWRVYKDIKKYKNDFLEDLAASEEFVKELQTEILTAAQLNVSYE